MAAVGGVGEGGTGKQKRTGTAGKRGPRNKFSKVPRCCTHNPTDIMCHKPSRWGSAFETQPLDDVFVLPTKTAF